MQPLTAALDFWPNVTSLADFLGVAPNTPHMWMRRGFVPVEYRPRLELASHGAVPVEQFGDDVQWFRVRDKHWPHPDGRPLADYAGAIHEGVPA